MRKVSSLCIFINQRPGCGFSIFNKSSGTSVGIPYPTQMMVGGPVGQEAAGRRHAANPSLKPIREVQLHNWELGSIWVLGKWESIWDRQPAIGMIWPESSVLAVIDELKTHPLP